MTSVSRATASSLPAFLLALVLATACGAPVRAEAPEEFLEENPDRPDGVHVLDGSYVINVGRMHLNVTNHGLIGSQYSTTLPYATAPSAQWPGGSGDEYLWGAGLWIGGIVNGERAVTTGQPERELRPADDIAATIYEARDRRLLRPVQHDRARGHRLPDYRPDDDGDGHMDEETLNGVDDDGDGQIDEDFGQIGDQMMVCTMHDDLALSREIYPNHNPLGVEVVQRVATWYDDDYKDIIAFDYDITNKSARTLEDVYLGFYVDCDIQNRADASTRPDDLTGFFDGAVRSSTGFHRIQVAYMHDANPDDPLPGYFGVILLDHDTDFRDRDAPHLVGITSYQAFATNAGVHQDGEPRSDEGRYELMARKNRDPIPDPEDIGDYKFIISSGPFGRVKPGATLDYRLAMVIGDGLGGMLQNAVTASILERGRWYDLDNDPYTGIYGMETKVCLGDYPSYEDGTDPLYDYRAYFMDEVCAGSQPRFGMETISKDWLFPDGQGRMCVWVNTDNCEECFRLLGQECTLENNLFWNGGFATFSYVATGRNGREGRIPWIYGGEVPPRPPNLRVVAGDHHAEIFWDDVSIYDLDYLRQVPDFESYRVWRVSEWQRPIGVREDYMPPAQFWSVIAQWDLVNFTPAIVNDGPNDLPLGPNTGLEPAFYRPACLDDPRFDGAAEAMQEIVDNDPAGELITLPPLRYADGTPRDGYESLLRWEYAPDVLDTFFAVTPREADGDAGVVGKRATQYFHYIDDEVHNGFRTYYSVTARDHQLVDVAPDPPWWSPPYPPEWVPAGYGIEHDPANNAVVTVPRVDAQTAEERAALGPNVYVYPNPVTLDRLADFDVQHQSVDNPTGMQIRFANLPAAHSTVKIYTAAGDLVQELDHDGTGGQGGELSWNLVSRNGQEINSGIYFFVVVTASADFSDFIGRFVVIR